jgi:hypothetical protein
MSSALQLQLHDAHPYTLGETIAGNVLVLEGGRSRSLEVRLRYNEKTKDYSKATTTFSASLHEGDLTKGTLFEFEVLVPEDGTPDYRTNHGELYWELAITSDELGLDTQESRRVEVSVKPRPTATYVGDRPRPVPEA